MRTKKNLDVFIFEQLRERMLEGAWAPEERLDVDRLAEDYQVSRTPVLLALRRMEAEGMTRMTRSGKFYLPAFSRQEIADIRRVLLLLAGESIRLLREGRGSVQGLSEPAQALADAAQAGDVPACCRMEAEWLGRLGAAGGNACLAVSLSKALGQYLAACAAAGAGQGCPPPEGLSGLTALLEQGAYDAALAGLEDYLSAACRRLDGSGDG